MLIDFCLLKWPFYTLKQHVNIYGESLRNNTYKNVTNYAFATFSSPVLRIIQKTEVNS